MSTHRFKMHGGFRISLKNHLLGGGDNISRKRLITLGQTCKALYTSIHHTHTDGDNVILCFTEAEIHKELSIAPIESQGQEPSSPTPCIQPALSHNKTVVSLS